MLTHKEIQALEGFRILKFKAKGKLALEVSVIMNLSKQFIYQIFVTWKQMGSETRIKDAICDKETSHRRFNSITLMSRFQATLRLFWDGPRNFEPQSDDEGNTRASPNICTTPPRERLAATYDLTWNRSTYAM
ncbi:hypothetical protein AVEN_189380-1 [Araneus ventricosus]|uniref:Uncharacterized protein n=1 Tax=Araneus ventricosus TaxID=182803 RepID=A0A4Y2USJ2_ARAVE|nr:hypothetical protein AVEN_189380-1 [Araneus ventricosus]